MIKSVIILASFLLLHLTALAQISGCTDHKAANYNPAAQINDGSCLYDTTDYYPELLIASLPYQLRENSGLILFDGGIWTHNDSGGKPEIYKIDMRSGKIVQTIRLNGARNQDWEDIAQDEQNIYIADIGNNNGNRTDLCIYKVSKTDIPGRKNGIVPAEMITFRFGDQSAFRYNPLAHNYDCEAMIACGDSLFLFTKNWVDLNTRLYALPAHTGDYTISPRAEFAVNGLITGADLNPGKKEVTLVGYHEYVSFIIILSDYQDYRFFSGNKRRVEFPDMVFTQTEGIAYLDPKTVLISCEESAVPPGIYSVNVSLWTEHYHTSRSFSPKRSIDVEMYRKPKSGKYFFRVIALPDPALKIEIYTNSWTRMESDKSRISYDMRTSVLSLDFMDTEPGLYFVKLISGEEQHVVKLFVDHHN